ncbi:MAG: carbohydrate ABC transporter permease [Alkalispirochaeta sp.]
MDRRSSIAAYLFLTPFLVILGVFFVYAAARAVWFSFTDFNLFNQGNWVGLKNYLALFREANFLRALQNSIVFAAIVTTAQTIGALLVAAALNSRIRGINAFRAAFYIPSIASSVVTTIIFLWLFQRRGLINYLATQAIASREVIVVFLGVMITTHWLQVALARRHRRPAHALEPSFLLAAILVAIVVTAILRGLGIVVVQEAEPVGIIWLQTRQRAFGIPLPLIAIMIQNTFTTIPTMMLLYLAALQDVSPSLYEAASLDGAGWWRQFVSVTLPSVRPITFLVVTLGLIGTLQMFDQVAIFGDAVPLESVITLAYFVYDRMFPGAQLPEVGLASAAALFLAFLTLMIVVVQRLFISSEGDR